MRKKIISVVLLLLLLGGAGGCVKIYQQPQQPPAPAPPANQAPIVSAGPAQECRPGGQVILQGSAYDPDGDQLTFSWSCQGGTLSSTTALQPIFYAPAVPGEYICTLAVTDRKVVTQSQTTVRVRGDCRCCGQPRCDCCPQQRCDCCSSCTTVIEDVFVDPFTVCQGQSFTVRGRVEYRCDCTATTVFGDPTVYIYVDGEYRGAIDTDRQGYFQFSTFAYPWMHPHSRHTVEVRSQYHCCREGSATAYFEVSSCGRPCGCAVCPCPPPPPQPCPCAVCPCPPSPPPPPPPPPSPPPCPSCKRGTPPPPPPGPSPTPPSPPTPPSGGGGKGGPVSRPN